MRRLHHLCALMLLGGFALESWAACPAGMQTIGYESGTGSCASPHTRCNFPAPESSVGQPLQTAQGIWNGETGHQSRWDAYHPYIPWYWCNVQCSSGGAGGTCTASVQWGGGGGCQGSIGTWQFSEVCAPTGSSATQPQRPPAECEALVGKSTTIPASAVSSGDVCVSGCKATPQSGFGLGIGGPAGQFYTEAIASFTGAVCLNSEANVTNTQGVTLGDGTKLDMQDHDTPEVNDAVPRDTRDNQPLDLDEVDDTGGCVQLASGGAFCIGTSLSPPAPNAGAGSNENEAAPPDGYVQRENPDGTTNTYYYYSQGTINASTRPITSGTGGVGGTTGSTTGTSTGGTTGGGTCQDDPATPENECGGGGDSGQASDSCDVAPSCSDMTALECAILQQQWKDTCRTYDTSDTAEADLRAAAGVAATDVEAVEGITQEFALSETGGGLGFFSDANVSESGAACPALPSFSVFGQSFQPDAGPMCTFLKAMGVVFMVTSLIAGVRIAFGG